MTAPTNFPNADRTRVLQMRITSDGRWFRLHPKDLELERYLEQNGGHATVTLGFLLSKDKTTLSETTGRYYHHVED